MHTDGQAVSGRGGDEIESKYLPNIQPPPRGNIRFSEWNNGTGIHEVKAEGVSEGSDHTTTSYSVCVKTAAESRLYSV